MNDNIGPQRAYPVSVARIKAQQNQLLKQAAEEQEEAEVSDYCESCGYAMITTLSPPVCGKCFKINKK